MWAKKAVQSKRFEYTKEKKWQGKLMTVRWEDEKLDGECFSWMTEWRAAPTHTIAGIMELNEQLLPTKLYNSRKTKTTDDPDARCRMCGKAQEYVAHVLLGCSVLAQTKYLSRHNAALKILFFELLKSYQLIEVIPPWYSPTQPKPSYENKQATVYWDVSVYADHIEVHANRVNLYTELATVIRLAFNVVFFFFSYLRVVQYCQLDSIGKKNISSIWRLENFWDAPPSRLFYLPFASH